MNFRITFPVFTVLLALFTVSCADLSIDDIDDSSRVYFFTFEDGAEEWEGGFSDYVYQRDDSESKDMSFSHAMLPDDAGVDGSGLFLNGVAEGDLFMFVKREFGGLKPNSAYKVDILVDGVTKPLSTEAVYGEADEPVTVKAGATAVEPVSVLTGGYYQMNINKDPKAGEQSDMYEIGNVAYEPVYDVQNVYEPFSFFNSAPIIVKTDKHGNFWAIVGTDSPYGSPTQVYYTAITVTVYE